MKKLFVALSFLSICTFAIAHTIEWYVGDNLLSTTTCNSSDNITPPTAPAKYGYTFDKWELPYTRLEYIESTGTQYIDTRIVPISGYTVISEFSLSFISSDGSCVHFGARDAGLSSGNGLVAGRQSNSRSVTASYFGSFYTNNSMNFSVNVVNKYEFKPTMFYVYKNNSIFTGSSWPSSTNGVNNTTLYLGALHDGNTVELSKDSIRFISFKIKNESGILILDLIPVKLDMDGKLGMYDTVSGQFFTNAGTGEFIAGPEIGGL